MGRSLSSILFYLATGAIATYTTYKLLLSVDDQDDHPPGRSQSYESSRSPVPRRDEQQHWQIIDSSQRPDHASVEVVQASPRAKAKQEGDLAVQYYQQIKERHDCARAKAPSEEGKRHAFKISNLKAEASAAIFSENNQDRQIIDSSRGPDHAQIEVVQASLRAKAKQECDLMSQCYQRSHDAYERGDHTRAKALSEEGKRHKLEMEKLNAEASAAIFNENNQGRAACEVDLHNLYVKEAIAFSERAISDARQRAYPEVRLIVGQGNHSDGGVSRLKPAIQEYMQTRGYHVEVDSNNAGVLVVQLGGK